MVNMPAPNDSNSLFITNTSLDLKRVVLENDEGVA